MFFKFPRTKSFWQRPFQVLVEEALKSIKNVKSGAGCQSWTIKCGQLQFTWILRLIWKFCAVVGQKQLDSISVAKQTKSLKIFVWQNILNISQWKIFPMHCSVTGCGILSRQTLRWWSAAAPAFKCSLTNISMMPSLWWWWWENIKRKQDKYKIKRGKICPAAIIRMRESGFPGPDVEELSDPHCCFAATQKSKELINKRKYEIPAWSCLKFDDKFLLI